MKTNTNGKWNKGKGTVEKVKEIHSTKNREKSVELKLGTWNIRTINGKEEEIVDEMKENGIYILGISETKKQGSGVIDLKNGYMLRYSGTKSGEARKEGVGFIGTYDMEKKITKWEAINSRIIYIELELEETTAIIQIYAPTEGSEGTKVEEFYDELQKVVDRVREKARYVIIMGDWNARIGEDEAKGLGAMGPYGEKTQNRNGKKMLDFCITNDLLIGNSFYEHRKEDRNTFEAEGRETKSIIDYIVYTQPTSKIIKDVRVETKAELNTDHRLLVAETTMEKTGEFDRRKYERIKLEKLRNEEIRQQYAARVTEALNKWEEQANITKMEDRWAILKQTLIEESEKICGKSKVDTNRKRTRWWSEEVKSVVREKKLAWKKYQSNKTNENKEDYIRKRNEAKATIKIAKTRSWENFGDELEDKFKHNNRQFWSAIKALKGNKPKRIWNIRDKNNELKTESGDILAAWKEYYEEKFKEDNGATEENTDLRTEQINETIENGNIQDEISQEEVEYAIWKLKVGKASGGDGIAPEMIKWGGAKVKEWIWVLCKTAWNENTIPQDWERNIIIPLHKKGAPTEMENYRAICLSSIPFKIYTRIIERRLRNEIENKMEEEQAAFRKNRQTNDHICVVREVIGKMIEKGRSLYLTFLDLKAAFDNVSRDIMWKILSEKNISGKLINVIKGIYNRVEGVIRIEGKVSDNFEMKQGLKQGDSLSPLLFIIYMDDIIKKCKVRTPKLNIGNKDLQPVFIQSLVYADDIVLMTDTQLKMQRLLNTWVKEIENKKMSINIKKSKVMIIKGKTSEVNEEGGIFCKGVRLEEVSTYQYLGTTISNEGKIDQEVLNRIKKATGIYYQLNKTVFGKKEIQKKSKRKVYETIVLPTLLYGSETWPTKEKHERQITAIEMKYMRKIVGITKMDRWTNERVMEEVEQEPIINKIEKRQLHWYGHITRMGQERMTKRVIEARRVGKRKVGRPRKKWEDRIKEIGQRRGKTIGEMKNMAGDKKRWKNWIET